MVQPQPLSSPKIFLSLRGNTPYPLISFSQPRQPRIGIISHLLPLLWSIFFSEGSFQPFAVRKIIWEHIVAAVCSWRKLILESKAQSLSWWSLSCQFQVSVAQTLFYLPGYPVSWALLWALPLCCHGWYSGVFKNASDNVFSGFMNAPNPRS